MYSVREQIRKLNLPHDSNILYIGIGNLIRTKVNISCLYSPNEFLISDGEYTALKLCCADSEV